MRLPSTSSASARADLRLIPASGRQAARGDLTRGEYIGMLAAVLILGFAVRAIFVLDAGFPINDGGMFYAMARDLQANSYALPAFTSYNGGQIPFAYPPAGFYIAAFLDDYTPVSLLAVFQYGPLILSTLTIAAFWLLARDLLRSRIATVAAVFFFAMMPPTITWMIMGGGMTRALGLLFALLTMRAARQMYRAPAQWRPALVAVLAALTVLSHLEMAWLACIVSAFWFAMYGRTRLGIASSIAVGALTIALTAPWWGTVIAHHGLDPLVAAVRSTDSSPWTPVMKLLQFDAATDRIFDVVGALALLGIAVCVARRQYALPLLVVAIAVLDQRAYYTSVVVPLALLAAIAVDEVILFVVTARATERTRAGQCEDASPSAPPRWLAGAAIGAVGLVALFGAIAKNADLVGLSSDERTAMTWLQDNTQPSSDVLVISGAPWPADGNAEWLPALTGRRSIATVQGYEWLPAAAFERQRSSTAAVEECATRTSSCIDDWMASYGNLRFDYVYVPKTPPPGTAQQVDTVDCCAPLRASLGADGRYAKVYDGPGATVFRRGA